MAERDIITMRQKDLKRLHVISKVLEGSLTRVQAAEIVSLSERQVRRIIRRIEAEGDKGIQHRSRGRQSNRKLPKKLTEKVVQLYQEKYQGFGPTLATEKLFELDGLAVSKETVRTWLMEAGQWQKGRKVRAHRQWRERKSCFGEMLQLDGSHHDWFEGRRPKCVLMAYIDDATSRVYGRFYEYEGTIPAMDSFKRYIRKHGIPMSIYMDRHTTYKSTAEPSIEDEINGTTPLSEFGRALTELEVKIIHAHSPQAKGKVERPMDYIRERFWRGYQYVGLGQSNRDIRQWNEEVAGLRVHGTTKQKVNDRFELERPHLGLLPARPYDTSERTTRKVYKDCQVSFGGNRYVVPHWLAGHIVLMKIKNGILKVYDDNDLMASYLLPEGKGQLMAHPEFYEALRRDKEQFRRKYRIPQGSKATRGLLKHGLVHEMVQRRPLSVYDEMLEVAHV